MNHNSTGRRARRRRPAIPAALTVAALLAAACSSGTHSSGTSAARQTAKKMDVFAQCMRSHGQTDFYYANPRSAANSSIPAFSLGG